MVGDMLLGTLFTLTLAAQTPACSMLAGDRAWIEYSLEQWRVAETRLLTLDASPLPRIIAIDAACTWTGRVEQDRLVWNGVAHNGTVTFPDGNTAPVGPLSFASTANAIAESGFFAMSLPSVWRAAGVKSGLGLERMMTAVLMHEIAHTRQFYFAVPQLGRLITEHKLPDDLSDDSLQDAFAGNPAYVADYDRERDLLYAADAAPTTGEARRLAGEALAAMRARREKWFIGNNRKWAALDDLFLTMEGVGQWVAYAWLVDPKGPGLTKDVALPEMRRGGRRWSQDEGLALFLVVDRLVPEWRRIVFADTPALAEALLSLAAR
jgi:hypothetical protein